MRRKPIIETGRQRNGVIPSDRVSVRPVTCRATSLTGRRS
jgi:hypothetical protein